MAQFATPFPDPNNGLLLGDIFSGIGGWELAAGGDWQCVFAAEKEPNASQVWEANHGRAPDVGDILVEPLFPARAVVKPGGALEARTHGEKTCWDMR